MERIDVLDGLDSNACDRVKRWLEERPSAKVFYALSPDRPYAHDEGEYDSQYSIVGDDLRGGWGC